MCSKILMLLLPTLGKRHDWLYRAEVSAGKIAGVSGSRSFGAGIRVVVDERLAIEVAEQFSSKALLQVLAALEAQ